MVYLCNGVFVYVFMYLFIWVGLVVWLCVWCLYYLCVCLSILFIYLFVCKLFASALLAIPDHTVLGISRVSHSMHIIKDNNVCISDQDSCWKLLPKGTTLNTWVYGLVYLFYQWLLYDPYHATKYLLAACYRFTYSQHHSIVYMA